MLSSVVAIFVCYWLSRIERKYIFKQPVGIPVAILNSIVVSIVSTAIAFVVVYVIIFDNFMHPNYKVIGDGLIREAMFGLIFSSLVSFSLLRAELKTKQPEPANKESNDKDNPWTQK